MLTMFKLKIVAALLGSSVSSGRHPMAFRQGQNAYAVLGEGTFRTKDCTVTAEGMDIVLTKPDRRGKRWVTFLDRDGEAEAQCEVDEQPMRHPLPVARLLIRRSIATTTGSN